MNNPIRIRHWLPLVFTLVVILPTQIHACSCFWGGAFVEYSRNFEVIVRAVVREYGPEVETRFKSADHIPFYHNLKIEITETLKGKCEKTYVTIIGEDGGMCRETLYDDLFRIGNEYLFALNGSVQDEHHLRGCGESSILIENGVAQGNRYRGGKRYYVPIDELYCELGIATCPQVPPLDSALEAAGFTTTYTDTLRNSQLPFSTASARSALHIDTGAHRTDALYFFYGSSDDNSDTFEALTVQGSIYSMIDSEYGSKLMIVEDETGMIDTLLVFVDLIFFATQQFVYIVSGADRGGISSAALYMINLSDSLHYGSRRFERIGQLNGFPNFIAFNYHIPLWDTESQTLGYIATIADSELLIHNTSFPMLEVGSLSVNDWAKSGRTGALIGSTLLLDMGYSAIVIPNVTEEPSGYSIYDLKR